MITLTRRFLHVRQPVLTLGAYRLYLLVVAAELADFATVSLVNTVGSEASGDVPAWRTSALLSCG